MLLRCFSLCGLDEPSSGGGLQRPTRGKRHITKLQASPSTAQLGQQTLCPAPCYHTNGARSSLQLASEASCSRSDDVWAAATSSLAASQQQLPPGLSLRWQLPKRSLHLNLSPCQPACSPRPQPSPNPSSSPDVPCSSLGAPSWCVVFHGSSAPL